MSTPNPTHIITEGMREVATEGQKGTPGTREDGQLWGAFPNTMTLTDLAAHVVSKLTDAGYSIIPTPRGHSPQCVFTGNRCNTCVCGTGVDPQFGDIGAHSQQLRTGPSNHNHNPPVVGE